VREGIAAIAGAGAEHCCVPLQGSGTFVVEAMLQTLIPRDGRLLVLVNGAYGRRILEIMRRIGRPAVPLECGEDEAVSPDAVRAALAADPAITDVALVHCETTSGILNPLAEIAAAVAASGRRLLVDAMSSFGAIAIDLRRLPSVTALAASSNKCLEGVPGIGFAVVARGAIERSAGNAVSLSLDLHAQWRGFEKNGQWRFTPPTQILAALDKALDLHAAGGGVAGRLARYAENCRTLVEGMRRLGFETLLRDDLQAPIIVTFRMPRHPAFRFADFYARLHARGFVIYPGKLTRQETFRIGCIGAIDAAVLRGAVDAVAATLRELGIAPGELYRG
jgi:2-aminoethylphosphonate-pyruvate transaminase